MGLFDFLFKQDDEQDRNIFQEDEFKPETKIDLPQLIQQSASNAGNFIKDKTNQFLDKKWVDDGMSLREVGQDISTNPTDYSLFHALRDKKLDTGIDVLDAAPQALGSYVSNRMIDPVTKIPENWSVLTQDDPELQGWDEAKKRGMGALGVAGGIASAVPDPTDALYGAYSFKKGQSVAQQEGKGFLDQIGAGFESLTGNKEPTLGESFGAQGQDKQMLDLAEIPLVIIGSHKLSKAGSNLLSKGDEAKRSLDILDNPGAKKALSQTETIIPDDEAKTLVELINKKNTGNWTLQDQMAADELIAKHIDIPEDAMRRFDVRDRVDVQLQEADSLLTPNQNYMFKELPEKTAEARELEKIKIPKLNIDDPEEIKNLNKRLSTAPTEMMGGLAGMEQDEDGNWRLDPEKAAIGIGLMYGAQKGQKMLAKNADEITEAAAKKADDLVTMKPNVIDNLDDIPTGTPPSSGSKPPSNFDDIILNSETGKLQKTSAPKYEFDLKSLSTPEEVKQTIVDLARGGDEAVQEARRGTITFKQTRAMADALGMSEEDVLKRGVGKIWNAEEADAATRIMLKSQEDLTAIGQEVRKYIDAGQDVPPELGLRHAEAAARAQGMMASAIGSRSEAARALNASKMMKEALDSGDAKAMKKAMKWFAGDEKKANEIMRKLSQFDPDDNLGRVKFLRDIKPTTAIDAIEEYWYNSVLSGTGTHVVNSASNAIMSLLRSPEKAVAGTLDNIATSAANAFGKQWKRDRYAAEAAAEIGTIGNGIRDGIRRAGHVLRHGVTEAEVSKLEMNRSQAIPGVVGNIINIPSRSLVAEDEFFKAINYDMELAAQAVRTAKNEGLQGEEYIKRVADLKNTPTPQMIESAMDKAKEFTLQSDNRVANSIRQFRDLGIDLKIAGKDFGNIKPLKFIIPFVQTPTNIVKYGLERSPLGFVETSRKILSGSEKGEVVDSASKALLGSLITVPLAMYFTQDKITGAAPADKKERDAFYADKKLPWSVKIGDQWVAYNRAEPFNSILSKIAMWHDAHKDGDDTWVEDLGEFSRAMARNTADQTFMQGMGNLMDAIEDPERFGQKFITDIIGGFIPSAVSQFARSGDNTVRSPETITDSLKARLPILSQEVPGMESSFEPGGVSVRHTNEGTARNIASNFFGMRSTPVTDTNYQEQVQDVKSLNKASTEQTKSAKQIATDIVSGKDVPDEMVTPDVLKELPASISDATNPATGEEKLLQGYSSEVRAAYMYKKLKELPESEQDAWIGNMIEKKILTSSVFDEYAKLSQKLESGESEFASILSQ